MCGLHIIVVCFVVPLVRDSLYCVYHAYDSSQRSGTYVHLDNGPATNMQHRDPVTNEFRRSAGNPCMNPAVCPAAGHAHPGLSQRVVRCV